MTITLTIQDNRKYVDANCPERIEIEDLSEISKQYGYESHIVKHYPYELNMCGSNIGDMFEGLGLPFDYCGEIHPSLVLAAIKKIKPSKLTKADVQDGMVFSQGRSIDYVSRRLFEFKQLAVEALRRGKLIEWY